MPVEAPVISTDFMGQPLQVLLTLRNRQPPGLLPLGHDPQRGDEGRESRHMLAA